MGKKDKDDDEEVSKQSLKLRLQKKIASGLINKTTLKTFLSDNHFSMLENLYNLLRADLNNKKEAKKYVNTLIKIVTKIAILQKNNSLKPEELKDLDKLAQTIQRVSKAAITFWEDKNLCDPEYFASMLTDCKKIIAAIAKRHLTTKSQHRVDFVFDLFCDLPRLNRIFIEPTPEILPHVKELSKSIRTLIENNEL